MSYHTSFWILRSLDKEVKRARTISSEHPSAVITIPTAVCATSCKCPHSCYTHLLTGLTSDIPAALMMPYLLAMSTWHSQAQVHMCFVVPVIMIFVGGRSHLFQTSVLIQHSSVESMSPPMGHSKLFLCTPGKAHLV